MTVRQEDSRVLGEYDSETVRRLDSKDCRTVECCHKFYCIQVIAKKVYNEEFAEGKYIMRNSPSRK